MFLDLRVAFVAILLVLTACDGEDSSSDVATTVFPAPIQQTSNDTYHLTITEVDVFCSNNDNHGFEISLGPDSNRNSILDTDEIAETHSICLTADSPRVLLDISELTDAADCSEGILRRLTIGHDDNADNFLDETEVQQHVDWCDQEQHETLVLEHAVNATEDESVVGNFAYSGLNNADFAELISPEYGDLQINDDGTYIYTPEANFFGNDEFTLSVISEATAIALYRVGINVEPVNDNPEITEHEFHVYQASSITRQITANDHDNDEIRFSIVTPPTQGELTLESNGAFSYTPYQDYLGEDVFFYQVEDNNGGLSEGRVVLNVINTGLVIDPEIIPPLTVEQNTLAAQRVTLRNVTDESIIIHISSDADWLGVNSPELHIPAMSHHDLTVYYDATVLSEGIHSSHLVFNSFEPGNSDTVVRVITTVQPDQTAPAAVSNLEVGNTAYNRVSLQWQAVADSGTEGAPAHAYRIRYSQAPINESNWDNAIDVENTVAPARPGSTETFDISGLSIETEYYFAIKVIDQHGLESPLSNVVSASTLAPPDFSLTPEYLGAMTIERHFSDTQTLTIENTGESDLSYEFAITSVNNTAVSVSAIENHVADYVAVPKGAADYRIGEQVSHGFGGPDNFGYRWKDSREANGPLFNWLDISETGETIDNMGDDTVSGPLPIGFDFNFYGEAYDSFTVSSNGFISFNNSGDSGCCSGQPIPYDDGINNIIAWLWDDLHPQLGQVYYQTLDNERLVIQFNNYGEYGGPGTVNAQVILSVDGDIKLQYLNFSNGLDRQPHSIGIENASGSDGLQIAFNTEFVENELAVLISPNSTVGWVFTDPVTGTVAAGETQDVVLTYIANGPEGDYAANLTISNNDPETPFVSMPLALRITEDETAPSVISDLEANIISFDQVMLKWTTPADAGVTGSTIKRYEIRYARETITDANWYLADVVPETASPARPGELVNLLVGELEESSEYFFAMKSIDDNDNISGLSNVAVVTTPEVPESRLSEDNISITLHEGAYDTVELLLSNVGGSALTYSLALETSDNEPESFKHLESNDSSASQNISAKKVLNALSAGNEIIPGQLLVKLDTKNDTEALESLQSQYQARTIRKIEALNMEIWQLSNNDALVSVVQAMNTDPRVIFAEPNYTFKTDTFTDDALFSDLWGLHNLGENGQTIDADIDAPEAWDLTIGSEDVVVAVIDTGIDYNHPDLAANMWRNEAEVPNNGIDDDNNGFVDDVYGYDFVNNDGDPMDDNRHGTHVAGTIGAVGNNGIGVVGVNHRVSLMGLKFLGSSGSGSTADAVESIIYSVDNGAHILNNSWGGGGYSVALEAAIEYARDNGVLFVAAAGNSGTDNDIFPSYPASYETENIIAVAATDANDALASFSQFGATSVDLAAPGVNTLSTIPGDHYESLSGTSMATPHVAGVAALLKARSPNAQADVIMQAIFDGVDPIEALEAITVTGGRLNAYNALMAFGPNWLEIDSPISGEVGAGQSASITLAFNASGLNTGEHSATLIISTNDPASPTLRVPVTLNVTADPQAPAAIEDLFVTPLDDTRVELTFTAPGDDGDIGQASEYLVAYSDTQITEDNWEEASIRSGLTTPAASGSIETEILSELNPGETYWIAIRALDNVGQISPLSNVVVVTTLSASLHLTPNPLPVVQLAQGESTEIVLSIANTGQAQLNVEVSSRTDIQNSEVPQESSIPTAFFAKGEVDTREGEPVLRGSGGPDDFGYSWKDSDEAGGPVFDWLDISESGTPLGGFFDDNVVGPLALGTEFSFYGEEYDEVYISSNGFIIFGERSNSGCCSGQPIPRDDSYNNIIAWLWYDLHPRNGTVHYELLENGTFVLQFSNYGEYAGSGTIDAQVLLHPNSDITIQYRDINNMSVNSASIGIENQTGDDGLQVAFNTAYVEEELAIKFHAGPEWMSIDANQLSVEPDQAEQLTLTLNAEELEAGFYDGILTFVTNDPVQPEVEIAITLEVVE